MPRAQATARMWATARSGDGEGNHVDLGREKRRGKKRSEKKRNETKRSEDQRSEERRGYVTKNGGAARCNASGRIREQDGGRAGASGSIREHQGASGRSGAHRGASGRIRVCRAHQGASGRGAGASHHQRVLKQTPKKTIKYNPPKPHRKGIARKSPMTVRRQGLRHQQIMLISPTA